MNRRISPLSRWTEFGVAEAVGLQEVVPVTTTGVCPSGRGLAAQALAQEALDRRF
jgi:hypothetical protein